MFSFDLKLHLIYMKEFENPFSLLSSICLSLRYEMTQLLTFKDSRWQKVRTMYSRPVVIANGLEANWNVAW
jgi:hypothetical protein